MALGSVFVRRKPTVTWRTRDVAGGAIAGAAVTVTTPSGSRVTVADDQPGLDQAATGGTITVILGDGPGKYSWCEVRAPTGFKLAKPACGSWDAAWESNATFVLTHESISR